MLCHCFWSEVEYKIVSSITDGAKQWSDIKTFILHSCFENVGPFFSIRLAMSDMSRHTVQKRSKGKAICITSLMKFIYHFVKDLLGFQGNLSIARKSFSKAYSQSETPSAETVWMSIPQKLAPSTIMEILGSSHFIIF